MTSTNQPTYGPAPAHAWIAPEHDETVAVRRTELRRFVEEVEGIVADPLGSASNWASATASLAVASLFALLASLAAQGDRNHQPAWLFITEGIALGTFTLVAIFCGWVNRKQDHSREKRAQKLIGELRECDFRAPRVTANSQG